jgi:hypothetical protein
MVPSTAPTQNKELVLWVPSPESEVLCYSSSTERSVLIDCSPLFCIEGPNVYSSSTAGVTNSAGWGPRWINIPLEQRTNLVRNWTNLQAPGLPTDGFITVLAPLLPPIIRFVFVVPSRWLLLHLRFRNIYNWAQGNQNYTGEIRHC